MGGHGVTVAIEDGHNGRSNKLFGPGASVANIRFQVPVSSAEYQSLRAAIQRPQHTPLGYRPGFGGGAFLAVEAWAEKIVPGP